MYVRERVCVCERERERALGDCSNRYFIHFFFSSSFHLTVFLCLFSGFVHLSQFVHGLLSLLLPVRLMTSSIRSSYCAL